MIAPQAPVSLDVVRLRHITLDDSDLMREILATMIQDTGTQLVALREAIDRRDVAACKRLAHYSKGACASIGAGPMATLLQAIENSAANLEFDACRESLRQLGAELNRIRAEAQTITF